MCFTNFDGVHVYIQMSTKLEDETKVSTFESMPCILLDTWNAMLEKMFF